MSSSKATLSLSSSSSTSTHRLVIITLVIAIFSLIGSLILSRNCLPNMASSSGFDEEETIKVQKSQHEQRQNNQLDRRPSTSSSSSTKTFADEEQLYNSIRRQPMNSAEKIISATSPLLNQFSWSFLPSSPSSCDQPYGQSQCFRKQQQQQQQQQEKKTRTRNNTSSSPCCCCCWRPHPMSCVGHFKQANPLFLKHQIEKTGFVDSSQPQSSSNRICPWFDRGFWPKALPHNFLDLPEIEASKIANEQVCGCPERNKREKEEDGSASTSSLSTGVGLMYMWELGRTMKSLRPMPATSSLSSTDKNGTGFRTNSPADSAPISDSANNNDNNQTNNSNTSSTPPKWTSRIRTMTRNAPGGVMMFAGDSMTRQVFSRMVHRIRSRECSSEAEKRRNAVFELQIHESAAYVATTLGDAFIISRTCEAGLDFLSSTLAKVKAPFVEGNNNNDDAYHQSSSSSSSSSRKHAILFQACFVWDNTASALLSTVANLHQLKDRVAAVIFFPQIWYCGTHSNALCMNANQSNGAVLSVIGTATHYSVPRIVVCTNVYRQTFQFYQMKKIKRRSAQLKKLFPFQPFPEKYPWIRSMMLAAKSNNAPDGDNDEYEDEHDSQKSDHRDHEKRNINNNNNNNNDNKKQQQESATSSITNSNKNDPFGNIPSPPFFWSNVRLYDFGARHNALAPEQCDVVHGMCMFLPARKEGDRTAVTSLFGGAMCPSPKFGMCQDMGNYHLLDEMMIAVKV